MWLTGTDLRRQTFKVIFQLKSDSVARIITGPALMNAAKKKKNPPLSQEAIDTLASVITHENR